MQFFPSARHKMLTRSAHSLFIRNVDLRRLVDENNAFAAVHLAYSLPRATSTASRLLVLATTQDYSQGHQIIDDTTFRLLILTVNNVFQAFTRLVVHRTSPLQETQNPLGAAIYSITNLFKCCLRSLKDAIALEFRHDGTQNITERLDLTGLSTASTAQSSPRTANTIALVAYIKDVMKVILTSVVDLQSVKQRGRSTKIPAHRELFEGIQHILITEAGKMLYTLTFSGPRTDSTHNELRTREDVSGVNESAQAHYVKAANSASRHLLPLIRHAISALPNEPSTSNRKRSSVTAAQAGVQRAMTAQPLRRLQNTLVQGIFGVSENDDLEDALRLPVEVVMQRRNNPAQPLQDENGDWFVKSMWELCGWDFLAKVA